MTFIISLSVLAVFGLMLRNLFDKNARLRRVAKNGIEAKAVLLNISYGKTNDKKPQQLTLQIQVYPETGRNFVADVLDPDHRYAGKYQVGDSFNVKFNPVNTREVIIVSGA